MRIAAHHRALDGDIEFEVSASVGSVERGLWDEADRVYASAIFERTRPVCRRLLDVRPDAIIGGSGWDEKVTIEQHGIATMRQDYTIYPGYPHSIGFTQRGCRLKCSFCKVPRMEGKVRQVADIGGVWRGDPYPRNLLLLDNDFFGQPEWAKRIEEINAGGFKVCWNQGFNVRLINNEQAAATASTRYYDDQFKDRRLYTAWDSRKDEAVLFRNLEALVRHGVKPDHIMVYMLIGYDHATKQGTPDLTEDDFHRHARLREFGCRPYPMPFVRSDATRGFQRWIVAAYDKRVSWQDWEASRYEPRRLGIKNQPAGLFDAV